MDKADNVLLCRYTIKLLYIFSLWVNFFVSCVCSSKDRFPREELTYSVTTEVGFKKPCTDTNCRECRPRKVPSTPPRLPIALQPLLDRPRPELPVPRRRAQPPPRPPLAWDYVNPDEFVLRKRHRFMGEGNADDDDVDIKCRYGSVTRYVAKKTRVLDNLPSDELLLRTFDQAFNRVRSVKALRLSGWRIEQHNLLYFANHKKLKNLREMFFLNCIMSITKDDFLTFLNSLPIKEINLCCRFKEFGVEDSCLMNLDKVYLNGIEERYGYFKYPGITDALLQHWMVKPPIKVDFWYTVAKFTIGGVMEWLKTSVAINSPTSYLLQKILVPRDELSVLMRTVQEVRKLIWKIVIADNTMYIDCWIKNNDKFHLNISLEVQDLEKQVNEKQQGHPVGRKKNPNKKEAKKKAAPTTRGRKIKLVK